jgi:hypothetical protein
MRVDILSMFTDKYHRFYDGWLEKINENFLPDVEKTIYLFSDVKPVEFKGVWTEIKHHPWPGVTLDRYINFSKCLPTTCYTDVVYMDIDVLVNRPITTLPEQPLFGINHPDGNKTWELETTITRSKAYVDPTKIPPYYHYKQGCFWGGKADRVNEMIKKLANDTTLDLCDDIIPKWHDESYLNRYFIDLHPSELYSYPVGFISGQTSNGNFDRESVLVHLYKDYTTFKRHEYK